MSERINNAQSLAEAVVAAEYPKVGMVVSARQTGCSYPVASRRVSANLRTLEVSHPTVLGGVHERDDSSPLQRRENHYQMIHSYCQMFLA